MAGNVSDYLEAAVLNWIRGTAMPAAPGTLYLALFTTATDDASGGTEVSGGAYARTVVTFSAPTNAGVISNASQVAFPVATANWGTITHAAVFTASSGGNRLLHGPLAASKTINSTERFAADAGQISFTLG